MSPLNGSNAYYRRAAPVLARINGHLLRYGAPEWRSTMLPVVRFVEGFQLSTRQTRMIARSVQAFPGKSVLIFGVGRDTQWWVSLAKPPAVLRFLEDDPRWRELVGERVPDAQILPVVYNTSIGDWQKLLHRMEELKLDLPPEVRDRGWDVVVVDGPAGHDETCPGRMSSIYEASRLVRRGGGIVWIHDAQREVEAVYADALFGDAREVTRVPGPYGLLVGYQV